MSDNKNSITRQLQKLGLNHYEAVVYLALLKGPATHLQLSRATGINRTKVYRLAAELEERSLITRQTDDSGTFLAASDPDVLESNITSKEEDIKEQRKIYQEILPALSSLKNRRAKAFSVLSYSGAEGFRQMLWHELKAQSEILIFGGATIEDLVQNKRWAERHRSLMLERSYSARELANTTEWGKSFTKSPKFNTVYSQRRISGSILPLDNQTVIYNETVAIYQWRHGEKVGVEIINKSYADTMRSVFEHYWALAGKLEDGAYESQESGR